MNFSNFKIGKKINLAFGTLILIFLVAFGVTKLKISQNAEVSERLMNLRVPTINASLGILNGINHSLAALRGWIILGKDKFKTERDKAWSEEILPSFEKMKNYSKNWTDPENVERLNIIKEKLALFQKYQKEIEDIAHEAANVPAIEILLTKATPKAKILSTEITKMIDIEITQEATKERKDLLGIMADVRGTIGPPCVWKVDLSALN